MPESIRNLLKKSTRDIDSSNPKDDSMSEITIVEKQPTNTVNPKPHKLPQDFNPADLRFGSCCRK
ncbi:hypothetical protein FE257_006501 [Aspergillus nanangensis]|uniref:Uncharacterized protein n=1 Tax=Aspergillus nanangensis TaxID=2582783 RepID=A0AAD4H0D9_ASPNN|nr:hypothetical protein FE257_006501 [Aspergillus nanangensis]